MEEWIEADKKLPEVFADKFRVRRANGVELVAFFYADAVEWIAFYGHRTSHWWAAHGDHERLDDVTHWKKFD